MQIMFYNICFVIFVIFTVIVPNHLVASIACYFYGFDCDLMSSFNIFGKPSKTVKCGPEVITTVDSLLVCHVTAFPQLLALDIAYRDLHGANSTPVVDYVDTSIGHVLKDFGIGQLNMGLLVRNYSHAWTRHFPSQFAGIHVNVAAIKCMDPWAFTWTSFNMTNRIYFQHDLTFSVPGHVEISDELTYNLEYPVACVGLSSAVVPTAGSWFDRLRSDTADGACLWKATYDYNGIKLAFFVRSSSQLCQEYCPSSVIEEMPPDMTDGINFPACYGNMEPVDPPPPASYNWIAYLVGGIVGTSLVVGFVVAIAISKNRRYKKKKPVKFGMTSFKRKAEGVPSVTLNEKELPQFNTRSMRSKWVVY